MADDDLKLGKPQPDPVRLEYPDPPAPGSPERGRPNAGRVFRRSASLDVDPEDNAGTEPQEDNGATE